MPPAETAPLSETVTAFLRTGPTGLWIDGGFRPARSGATLESTDPATGEHLATVAAAGAEDVDDAVTAALAAGLWTRDVGRAHRVAGRLRGGTVWVNTYGAVAPAAPFGGFKQSGWGREMGEEALRLYSEIKTVWANVAA